MSGPLRSFQDNNPFDAMLELVAQIDPEPFFIQFSLGIEGGDGDGVEAF